MKRFKLLALIITAVNGIIMNAMNISLRREKENLITTAISAVINIGLNFIFIPIFFHNGAAFTTLISEFCALIFSLIRFPQIKNYLEVRVVLKTILHAGVGTILIIIFSIIVNRFIENQLVILLILLPSYVIIYIISLTLLKDAFFILNLKKIIRNK